MLYRSVITWLGSHHRAGAFWILFAGTLLAVSPEAALSAVGAGGAGGGNAKPAPLEPVTTQIYNVSNLTRQVADYPGPNWQLSVPSDSENENEPDDRWDVAADNTPTPESIADMIHNRIQSDSWDPSQGTSIEVRAGMLVIMQRPSIHARIRKLLQDFGRARNKQLSVQALLVDVEPARLMPFLGKAGKSFRDDRVKETLKTGRLRGMPQLVARNGQRVHSVSGTRSAYLADVEISGDARDPVVRELLEGIVLDVRPMLSSGGRFATLELRLSVNENVRIRPGGRLSATLNTGGARTGAQAGARPPKMEAPELSKKKAAGVQRLSPASSTMRTAQATIESASVDQRHLRQSLRAPIGRWVLAGILPPVRKQERPTQARSTLVFLLVNTVEP